MKKAMRAAAMVALVMFLVAGSTTQAAVQQVQDERGIIQAVTDVLRAESEGDTDRLHDLLVPEERQMIPREAFAIWFAGATETPAGAPEVGEITAETWISILTGDRYDAVVVEYTVEVVSDQQAGERADEMVLWNDGTAWRWFFDGGQADIAAVTDGSAWSVEYESPYQNEMFRNIDHFWAQVFADHGLEYWPPTDVVGVRVQPIKTGCGIETNIARMMVYYCTKDETIYYDPEFRDDLVDEIGDFAWVHVIAHEWGHHIQKLLGITASHNPDVHGGQHMTDHELQADCLSAIFEQDAFARELIDTGDLTIVATITGLAGDSSGVTRGDAVAHGTGSERQQAWDLGFDDGFIGCGISLEAAG